MSIRDWPAGERPREKLIDLGPQALSEAELLAILIRTGTRGMPSVRQAHQTSRTGTAIDVLLPAVPELMQASRSPIAGIDYVARRFDEALLSAASTVG